ncbi:hypothetical protein PM082_022282 [Marasmius tenuissimus]|nr:hypothetical protein PM082_022282 [Marasmius tenuissimus]
MAYRLLHPRRSITQRHEFWQSSEAALPTQIIAARQHFTKDSYIQATWRGDERALTGMEFFQRSAQQHREYAEGGCENAPTTTINPSKNETSSGVPSPRSPRSLLYAQTRRSEATKENEVTLEGTTDDEVVHEEYIVGILQPIDEEADDMADTYGSQEPLDPPHESPTITLRLSHPNVAIPKPNLQRYKSGQFPLKSLKDDYGWDNDTYSRVQVSRLRDSFEASLAERYRQKQCKKLVPTYFNPRVSWIRQRNKEESESRMREEMMKEFPFLNNYVDCWPVHHFIQRTLKGTSEKAKRKREDF